MIEMYKKSCEAAWARAFEHCITLRFEDKIDHAHLNVFFVLGVIFLTWIIYRLKSA